MKTKLYTVYLLCRLYGNVDNINLNIMWTTIYFIAPALLIVPIKKGSQKGQFIAQRIDLRSFVNHWDRHEYF